MFLFEFSTFPEMDRPKRNSNKSHEMNIKNNKNGIEMKPRKKSHTIAEKKTQSS